MPVAALKATDAQSFLLIEWQTENGQKGKNHFSTKTLDISYAEYLASLEKCGMDEFEGF